MDEILNYERNLEDDYYHILGCDELSSEEQIVTEYKARVLDCHPDKHPGDDSAVNRFTRLQTAKEVLSDPESRKKYDQWRHSGVSMTYDQWRGLRDSVHVSMHWGSVKPQPMLVESSDTAHLPPGHGSSPKQGQTTLHVMQTTDPNSTVDYSGSKSRSPSSSPKKESPWERDPASNLLKKFRNYEV